MAKISISTSEVIILFEQGEHPLTSAFPGCLGCSLPDVDVLRLAHLDSAESLLQKHFPQLWRVRLVQGLSLAVVHGLHSVKF